MHYLIAVSSFPNNYKWVIVDFDDHIHPSFHPAELGKTLTLLISTSIASSNTPVNIMLYVAHRYIGVKYSYGSCVVCMYMGDVVLKNVNLEFRCLVWQHYKTKHLRLPS